MKWCLILLILAVSAIAENALPLAKHCDPEACQLPNCRCSSTEIPGELEAKDTPQFIIFSFDTAINVLNIQTFREILYGRRNKNGCKVGATFFVNHEYNDYQLVNELHINGFEIGLRTISMQPQGYWATATRGVIEKEIGEQRSQMAQFAQISHRLVRGVRMPFLQLAGNHSFSVMADHTLYYDSSWPTFAYTDPGLWPYTLDFASIQECVNPPCPTASIPGVWELPIIAWTDLNGTPCLTVAGCYWVPSFDDEERWYKFFINNFMRHYRSNRAPFQFNVGEPLLAQHPAVKQAVIRFMDFVNDLDDVFMVTAMDVIDWVKNPTPLGEYRKEECRPIRTAQVCQPTSCGPLRSSHNNLEYWMQLCTECPDVYPWVGNPFGFDQISKMTK